MQIFAEDSSVQASTVSNAAGIITNKRSLESTVLVDEGQLIVLGGLMQDSVSEGVSKVPILGDIPFIGALFRSETRQRNKTNLMIFIRPHVMRSADSYQSISQDRYEYIRGAQTESQMPSRWALPDMVAPTLPEMTQGHSAPAVTKPPEMPQSQSSPAAVDVLKP
jgi:general secretion pathway protein D